MEQADDTTAALSAVPDWTVDLEYREEEQPDLIEKLERLREELSEQ